MGEDQGERRGRYVIVRDADGGRHAVAAGTVQLACEAEDGTTIVHLAGGRALRVAEALDVVVGWFV